MDVFHSTIADRNSTNNEVKRDSKDLMKKQLPAWWSNNILHEIYKNDWLITYSNESLDYIRQLVLQSKTKNSSIYEK